MRAGWKNMLLHIFRLEEGAAEAAGDKSVGAQEPRGLRRRVEDIIGRSPARYETGKVAGYAADGTLAARCFASLGRYIRESGSKIRSGVRRSWVRLGEEEGAAGFGGRRYFEAALIALGLSAERYPSLLQKEQLACPPLVWE